MNNIVKFCKKHGNLKKDSAHHKGKSITGKQYWGCNLCKHENAINYYNKNIVKIKEKAATYHQKRKTSSTFKIKKKKWMHDYQKRRRNERGDELREKELIIKRNYYKRNRESILERQKQHTANLAMHYVRYHLKKNLGFENPSDDLVKTKALLMLLKREIMNVNYNLGKNKYVKKTKRYKNKSATTMAERRILGITQETIKKS